MTEPNQESQRQPRNRYPGARPFTDSSEDQQIFFGREGDLDRLYERVIASRLLVMFSKSGLGKTSLLMAGLFPKLRREKALFPVPIRVNAPGTPADIVIEAVKQGCKRAGVELTSGNTAGIWEFLLSSLIWSGDLLLTPVLVFDQFEEIFTLCDSGFRTALATELGALASALPPERLRTVQGGPSAHPAHLGEHAPEVKILLSLREEYLGTLLDLSVHIPGLFQERFRVTPLGENEARVAICGPAERVAGPQDAPFATPPFTYNPDALQELLTFLQDRSGVIESFQLQLLCCRAEEIINARAKELMATAATQAVPPAAAGITFRISRADLGGSAGMQEVLRRFYKRAIGTLRWSDRRHARRLCEEGLVSATGSRIMLHEAQIRSDYGVRPPTLKGLVNAGLLRCEQRRESLFYEISHDQLATSIEQSRPFRIPRKYRQMIYGALVLGFFTIGTLLYANHLVTKQRQIATWKMLALEAPLQAQTGDDDLAGLLARQGWLIHKRLTGQQMNLIDYGLRSALPTDNVRHILRAHDAAVLSVAFSPAEGERQELASGGFDGTVRIWDLHHSEKKPTELELPILEGGARSVAINREGTMLAAGSENGQVHVWDLGDPNRKPVELPLPQKHSDRVWSVAFSPVNGEQLASASMDGTILIWDFRHPEGNPSVVQKDFGEVTSVVFDPKGESLASGGIDGKVRIWNLSRSDSVTLPSEPGGGAASPIVSLAFNPDGTKLAVGRKDKTISVSDLLEPERKPVFLNNDVTVVSVTFSPDGRYLVSAHDGKIRMWDLNQSPPSREELPAGQGVVRSVAFSPNGELLASGGEDAAVRIWELHKIRPTVLAGPGQAAVHSVAFSPNGEKVAWGDYDGRVGRVRISDPRNPGAEAGVLPGIAEGDVWAIAFSPDGKKMASGSGDSIVRIWDLGAPQSNPVKLAAPPGAVWSVAFSPESDRLAAGTADGTLRIWDLRTRTLQEATSVDLRDPKITNYDPGNDTTCDRGDAPWPKADAYTVAFSRDKNQLVAGYADGKIRVWDLRHPEAPPKRLDGNVHDYVCSVVFTADGRLVSGSGGNTIRIWDLKNDNAPALILTGHSSNVLSVAVSPDGTRLASASKDKQIRIWPLQEILKLGEPEPASVVLTGHDDAVFSVAFDPKGSTLISASADKTVRVWQQSAALAENVCSWVWRNLSMTEWRLLIGEGLPYECTCPMLPRGADVPAVARAENCQ